MRVLVAMSGGVDSSVAAALLHDAGHDVVGATMKLWGGASDSGKAVPQAVQMKLVMEACLRHEWVSPDVAVHGPLAPSARGV